MKTCASFFLVLLCGPFAGTAQEAAPAPAGPPAPEPTHVEIEFSALECTFPADKSPLETHPVTYDAIQKLPQKSVHMLESVSGKGKSGEHLTAKHIINPSAGNPDSKVKPDDDAFASGAIAEFQPIVGGKPALCDVGLSYHLRTQTDARDPHTLLDVNFNTSFTGSFQKPAVVNVSAVPGHEGSFIAVVATLHLLDADGKPAGDALGSPNK